MCNESVKRRRYTNWPRQIASEPRGHTPKYQVKKRSNIVARFLPRGWRFLRPREEVEKTDFFWSHTRKCYLPVVKYGQLSGVTIPFIRRKESG